LARNIRVYMLARELEIQSKDVLKILQEELNLDVDNHMMSVNAKVADRIRKIVAGEDEAEEPPERTGEPETESAGKKEEGEAREAEQPEAQRTEERTRAQKKDQSRDEAETKQEKQRSTRTGGQAVATKEIAVDGPLTVGELAEALEVASADMIQKLMSMGIMASVNQQLDEDTIDLIGEELDIRVQRRSPEPTGVDDPLLRYVSEPDPDRLEPRAPVVTVMGHVDHGKTTLLDTIRHTSVIDDEMGGITQHMGASTVYHNDDPIVFLDTPGHEAFTSMRARGAHVTDIVVLVVGADDGVMPQTIEAIDHAKEAGVPIIVAVNKVDVPNAQPDRVRQELAGHELVPEEWGGETIYVDISALQGDNVDELMDMIVLLAEMEELQADPTQPASGVVVEAELDRQRGSVCTVLIQDGTLHRGDPFVAGAHHGRVRAMFNSLGSEVDAAGPSTPVEVMGTSGVPEAGDLFVVMEENAAARDVAKQLQQEMREEELRATGPLSLEEFYRREEQKELRIVLKADVQGSLEACTRSLERIDNDEVSVRVIHGGVGAITESDIMLASASAAVVIGFNVRPNAGARRSAEQEGVDIRTYRIIYELIEEVESATRGMLDPEFRERVIGRAEVRETFQVPGGRRVAGLYVREGNLRRRAKVRVVRDGRVIHEGDVGSLRRFQDDVREVSAGYECGLGVENFNDVEVGDEIEAFVIEEVARE